MLLMTSECKSLSISRDRDLKWFSCQHCEKGYKVTLGVRTPGASVGPLAWCLACDPPDYHALIQLRPCQSPGFKALKFGLLPLKEPFFFEFNVPQGISEICLFCKNDAQETFGSYKQSPLTFSDRADSPSILVNATCMAIDLKLLMAGPACMVQRQVSMPF